MNPEESPQEGNLSQIRTYQGDIAGALGEQKESLVSIQQTEVARKRASGLPMEAEPSGRKKTILLVLGALLLIVLGSFGGWYTYREFVRKTTPPATSVLESRLIQSSEETALDISLSTSRLDLIKTVREKTDAPMAKGGVRHIVLRENSLLESALVSTQLFVKTLETGAPSSLVRALDRIFMFGTIGGDIQSNFLIIKIVSFENVFAGMLAWEEEMARDIGPLFATAEKLKNLESASIFTDITTKNKDARALLLNGEIVILYSFFDNRTLIITDNVETLHTIIARLNAESLSR